MNGPVEPRAGTENRGAIATASPTMATAADPSRPTRDGDPIEAGAGGAGKPPVVPPQETSEPEREEPDAFRLRPRQPQVMRLSRKAIAMIGLGLGIGVGGSLIWALKSSHPQIATNLYDTATSAKPGVVSGAPADYSQFPRLGPGMPGDLGKPFLSAQQRGHTLLGQGNGTDGANAQMGNPSAADGVGPGQAAVQQRQQRMVQESDAARGSQLFFGSAGVGRSAAASGGDDSLASVQTGAAGAGKVAAPMSVAPGSSAPAAGSQAGKRLFLAARSGEVVTSDEAVTTSASSYVLQAGSIIPAALITGIRSDLPGQITAQVTQNVYDSPTGRLLLIPQGARLIGEYDSEVSAGQNRVLLAWDRLILPDGRSIRLDRQPGADASGMAGLQDKTNYHWGNMVKAAFVSTLLGMGTQLATQDDSALVQALRYGMQDTISQTGQKLVQRELNVAPTLTVRPGFPLRVIVTHDVIFDSVLKMEK